MVLTTAEKVFLVEHYFRSYGNGRNDGPSLQEVVVRYQQQFSKRQRQRKGSSGRRQTVCTNENTGRVFDEVVQSPQRSPVRTAYLRFDYKTFYQYFKDITIPFPGSVALKDVSVTIPQAANIGDTITLQCHYDLEGEPLYTVKWYKGQREFFRYIPKELPSTQIFPYYGMDIDIGKSTPNTVVLRNVQQNMTGKYGCEVSTDAPNFYTLVTSAYMYIVPQCDSNHVFSRKHDLKQKWAGFQLVHRDAELRNNKVPIVTTVVVCLQWK
ncbi:beat protein [Holotrichia oblita]|uniref:Beat protein n=1 Tax=Holotrichia oblita TaxID=644536 RepID=A0ACB9SY34_HOLOL|nr:beat protein [Holotrichia oblita]